MRSDKLPPTSPEAQGSGQPISGQVAGSASDVGGLRASLAQETSQQAQLRRERANAIRVLAADVVEAAGSGHPGTAMGMAEIAEVLWSDFLRHNPNNPNWLGRDRFVQSNGHAAMLSYALLHLTGYDLAMDELRAHRKLHARTPGHPERGITPGIETTTGPLGQGFANAVGMAIAERKLSAEFNRPGFDIVDHRTWVFLGDGCLMEGVTQEAASLAGALGLAKLTAVYDDNGISIDGEVTPWFAEDVPARFRALGWHVLADVDGHDPAAIHAAFAAAQAETERPSLICCRTVIGKGAPNKAGKEEVHGAPLGADEMALMRQTLGWSWLPFDIPPEIRDSWDMRAKGASAEAEWQRRFDAYAAQFPDLARAYLRRMSGDLPEGFDALIAAETEKLLAAPPAKQALRKAVNGVTSTLVAALPELIGGSADLSASTQAWTSASHSFLRDAPSGNFIHYGVREFGMSAAMNGIAAHGGLIPYGATYLVFSDYARNAVRMAALMGLRSIFLYTHDSIGVGEDGPTHQPAEQLLALRAIPGMSLWRPGSALEALVAWEMALRREGPSVIVAGRQDGAPLAHRAEHVQAIRRGGYVLEDSGSGQPELILAATGTELVQAQAAYQTLAAEGVSVRLVSIPNANLFAADAAWRETVLLPGVPVLIVEAGAPWFWHQFLSGKGRVMGVERFGESAPASALYEMMGLTAADVLSAARELLG